MRKVTLFASGSRGTSTSPSFGLVDASTLLVYTNVTVGAGTSLSCALQCSNDNGTTWVAVTDGTNAAITAYTTGTGLAVLLVNASALSKASATGSYGACGTAVPSLMRMVNTVTGGNPTYSQTVELQRA